LLVRLSALGDVIQTLPIVSRLQTGFPGAKIGWAINSEMAPAIEGHPAVDYIHKCNRKSWSRMSREPREWHLIASEMRSFIHEIREVGYDLAIDVQGLAKSAVIPFLAGIPRRVGYAHGRELSNIFYTETYISRAAYFDPSIAHLDHMAALCTAIGCPPSAHRVEPPVPPLEVEVKVSQMIQSAFPNRAPVIGVAVATQWESKNWPEKHWLELLNLILAETDCNIALLGAPSDSPQIRRIYNSINPLLTPKRVIDLSGKTSIPEMYCLYKQVDVAIGSDSAPLHIAGAMGTPHVFAIFGPTAHRRTAPFGSPDVQVFSSEGQLSCQPCHKKKCPLGTKECLERITPAQITQRLREVLQSKAASSLARNCSGG
jgi:lipopolysaccharide heptosyltransferase II